MDVLSKRDLVLNDHQSEAIDSLERCLYLDIGNSLLYDKSKRNLTKIGSTHVAGIITTSMNSFNDVINLKYSNAANPKIIDKEFRDVVSSCFFRKAVARIQKHPQQRNALAGISSYIEELRTNYPDFEKNCR